MTSLLQATDVKPDFVYSHQDGYSCDYGNLIATIDEILKYGEGYNWELPTIKTLDRKTNYRIRRFLNWSTSNHWRIGVNLKTKRFLHKHTFRPVYGNYETGQYSPFKLGEDYKLLATICSPKKWYVGSEQSKPLDMCLGKKDRIKTFQNFLGVKDGEPFTICSIEELFNIREWRKEFKFLYQTVLEALPKLQRAIRQEKLKEAKTLKFKIIQSERHLEERLEIEWDNLTPVQQQIKTDSQSIAGSFLDTSLSSSTPSYLDLQETQYSLTYGQVDMLAVYRNGKTKYIVQKLLPDYPILKYRDEELVSEYIPIELKYKEDRNARIQLIRYIEDLEVLLEKKVKEAWLIVPKIYPAVLLPVIRHNRYDPVKIRLFEWTVNTSNIDSAAWWKGKESEIYLEEYTDMDVETYKTVYNKG